MKAATERQYIRRQQSRISIHAAREGGDVELAAFAYKVLISIHAAREGGDDGVEHEVPVDGISIHAAREGGDAAPYLV